MCVLKDENQRIYHLIIFSLCKQGLQRGKTKEGFLLIRIEHLTPLRCKQFQLEEQFPRTQQEIVIFLLLFIYVGCLLPGRFEFSVLKNCKQDPPQSNWRVLGFSENHEDETTLKWIHTFCNCVCLATNLSLSWIHRESVRNEVLDTNESGFQL